MSSIFFNHPIELESLATLEAILEGIIPFIKNKDILLFEGPLGAGKTTSARFIIQALVGEKIDVPSPTFNLVHTYETRDFPLWHFDLYRLKNEEELFDIGIEEALSDGVLMIEWPEKGGQILPLSTLKLQFHFGENDTRFLTLIPSREWQERIKNDTH
ncbi:MAG: tRNA (adenosine(37)-N6)-threonylcarbamoyltransferase complex ATPase subunit type 1 TsaE [Alphaproteobacteria bacterium]|nr:tRNA (adenosine(37)-N6)-threonylcarbamoyltransferase complex ATPase subunit type 1 TsaE [Alphaproteobacteria bacterium]